MVICPNPIIQKEYLIETFEKGIKRDSGYIVLFIEVEGINTREIIINERANFEYKLDYYKKTYDENLTHRFAKGIVIKDILLVSSLNKLSGIIEDEKRGVQALEIELDIKGIKEFKNDLEGIEMILNRIIEKYEFIKEKVTKNCEVQ